MAKSQNLNNINYNNINFNSNLSVKASSGNIQMDIYDVKPKP